jgi:hypothetical protein
MFGLVELECRNFFSIEFAWGGDFIFFFKLYLVTENQLSSLPGSGSQVCVVGGGWWWVG